MQWVLFRSRRRCSPAGLDPEHRQAGNSGQRFRTGGDCDMTLKLYFHPLASYCHKVLIALYEHDIAFEPILVDLGDEKSSAAFRALWPLAKFPVLRDEARNC